MNINKISKIKIFPIKKRERLLFSHCKYGNMGRCHSSFLLHLVKLVFITLSPTDILCSPLDFCQHLSCHETPQSVCDLRGPCWVGLWWFA